MRGDGGPGEFYESFVALTNCTLASTVVFARDLTIVDFVLKIRDIITIYIT